MKSGVRDAVIIGSGAGGGPLALALSRAGLDILVLEKGPRHRPEDYPADELANQRHAWCHGAPGIGLGHIGSLPYLDDPEMLDEIRTAVQSTLAEGFGFNHCLCHGDLGNLELVRAAGRVLEDADLEAKAKRIASGILAQIEQDGPRSGASIHTEIPGLLTGLAGIGYSLLRAAYPERVPSVLLLEIPA